MEVVNGLIGWMYKIAMPLAVVSIIYAGFLFMTSQGEPNQITKAREILKYTMIGLAIIIIGTGFISLIKSIINLGVEAPSTQSGGESACDSTKCPTGQVCIGGACGVPGSGSSN